MIWATMKSGFGWWRPAFAIPTLLFATASTPPHCRPSWATRVPVSSRQWDSVISVVPGDHVVLAAAGAGTVLKELKPEIGSSLVVFGAGAVGCAAVMAARVADCATIVAVDIHDSRLELARELGATHVINSKAEDVAERLRDITAGAGVDYVVDTTGIPALLRQAADALGVRGTVALVGAAKPCTEVSFEIGASLVKGWTFKTVVQGSSVPQVFIPRLIQLWKEGRFPFEKLVSDYVLEDINQGFEDSKSGRTIKPVIIF
jgi:aryl-alcohol dehydrogenase